MPESLITSEYQKGREMNACPKCGESAKVSHPSMNFVEFQCGTVLVGAVVEHQSSVCKSNRAADAARHLMIVIAGACDDGKERWSRKELRRLYDHLKQQYPEFAP